MLRACASLPRWKFSGDILCAQVHALIMSSRTKASQSLLATKWKHSQRMQHTDGKDVLKLQFPALPKEWEGKYIPGQMYQHQHSLPGLPVPPLQQTLQKYITSVEPLISKEELDETKAVVAEFGKPGGVGEKLQEKLLERAKVKDSWLIEWWNRMAYFAFRESVVVNSSPAIGFPLQEVNNRDVYVQTIARNLLCILKWNLLVQNEAIPPDVYRNKPMCMGQHDMFSKCRIPGPEVDVSRKTPISESRHIIVIRNGHFFKLDVLYECPDGTLAVPPASHIIEQLHYILNAVPESCEYPVGILTTEHRDTWYQCRERLLQDPVNRSSLEVIETAQFVVCLDKAHSMTDTQVNKFQFHDFHKTVLANRFLHGNGSQHNSINRWFDAAIQFFVGEDGGAGSILEHSAADGPPAIVIDIFILDTQKIYDVLSERSPVPSGVLCPVEMLKWNLSPQSAKDIETAKYNLDKLVKDVDLQVMTFTDFGKNIPKSFKLSPDGFVQNAIQLAYYKLYKKTSPMYESGATRWFKSGRTDTIRSTTNASHTFLKEMSDPNTPVQEKADSLVAAVKAHSDYTLDAISGQAVDRHLLGLKLIALESGMETPDIFKEYAYNKSLHFCLSTSQVPVAQHELFLCFGAVVPDGYGVCYNPQETKITVSVSSFRGCPETDSLLFGAKLAESLREMQAVLTAARGLNAKL